MTNTGWSLAMERDELVRLAGEQALLAQAVNTLSAQHTRDKQALQGLANSVQSGNFGGRNSTWLQDGIALLTRLHETQLQLRDMNGQLNDLRKLTGLP
jgi:hypothetical protein